MRLEANSGIFRSPLGVPKVRGADRKHIAALSHHGSQSPPSAISGLAGKGIIIKNKESDSTQNINITTVVLIRYGISATTSNPFTKQNLSNISYFEMRR